MQRNPRSTLQTPQALFFGLLALLLAACGAQRGGATSPHQLLVGSADLSQASPRLVLILWDGPERLSGVESMTVALFRLGQEGEATAQVWQGEAKSYQMGALQYWVSYPDFPAADVYGVKARYRMADGATFENQAVLQVKAEAEAPTMGQAVPASQTRTLADAPLDALSSAPPYDERFYQLSIAGALARPEPSLIVFATPGYCSSQICGPVLESVTAVANEFEGQLNVVHVELYRDFEAGVLDPAVLEWGLPSDPWLFVLRPDGTVGQRLDGVVGGDELREAVEAVLGG